MMKVYAANADMVRLLKHPIAGGFLDIDTPVEWPDDSFTFRRVRDGDVKVDAPVKKEQPAEAPAEATNEAPAEATAEAPAAPAAEVPADTSPSHSSGRRRTNTATNDGKESA
jgi:hypothetical protein